jgi:hypothetical protein
MRSAAIRQQIETRTRHAFGRHVWPHLFRDCAVTELVDSAPDATIAIPREKFAAALGADLRGRRREKPGGPRVVARSD